MKTRTGRALLGILMLILSIYLLVNEISTNGRMTSYISLLIFALAVMFLSLSYLTPQFDANDERIRMIREKGMFYSYFLILAYLFIFITTLSLDIITISSLSLAQIFGALIIITVFVSQVILSKIY